MKTIKRLAVSVTLTALTIGQAQAAQSGLPWEAPLQTLTDSLTGPVLQTFLIISIVVAAVSFFPGFFGFAGAATF